MSFEQDEPDWRTGQTVGVDEPLAEGESIVAGRWSRLVVTS
jgi:hypothetical protein